MNVLSKFIYLKTCTIMKIITILSILLCTVVLNSTAQYPVGPAKSEPINVEGSFYALLIGVNEYSDDLIADLEEPISNASKLSTVLSDQYIFDEEDVAVLKNPVRSDIILQLDNMIDQITSEDNLLIFYAGRGHWDENRKEGYWLPSDADMDHRENLISNSTIRDYISKINSKNTLLIIDASYGGSIFSSRSAILPTLNVKELYDIPSRKAITSSTLSEVPDKSIFFSYLVRRLDENREPYLATQELYSMIRIMVINNSDNVPQYGTIQNVGDEGGDFVFIKRH